MCGALFGCIFRRSSEAARATLRSAPQGIAGRGGSTRREAKASLPAFTLNEEVGIGMNEKPSKPRGRPRVEVRKEPFPIMLDPRYIELMKKTAAERGETVQVLARKALYTKYPGPFRT